MAFEVIRVETLHEGWAKYLLASIRLPDGTIIKREIEDHGTAVCVLPYDSERRTAILVQQLRAPVLVASQQVETLEAIAGTMDEADPETTARREAFEEAGLKLEELEFVATLWPLPAISTERLTLFLARYTSENRIGPGGGIDHEQENITVVELALCNLASMADSGNLVDMKTMLLLQTLRLRRPELFDR